MSLVDKLKSCEEMNQIIRPVLAKSGATDWQTLSTPLAKLSEPETMALIMNWTAKAPFKNNVVQIRLRDTTDQEIYDIWLTKSFKEGTRIARIRKSDQPKNGILYDWPVATTYANLTRVKLEVGIVRANRINDCATSKQML